MITNERQYKITQKSLDEFAQTLHIVEKQLEESPDSKLASIQFSALKSQIEDLQEQIEEYETLKSGTVRFLDAYDISEIPTILIKARIANGLTQAELATKVGIKEQQIQRYESSNYKSTKLERISEIAKALGLRLNLGASISNRTESSLQDYPSELFKEIYKRGWFEGFQGSYKEALPIAPELIGALLDPPGAHGRAVAHRRHIRSNSTPNMLALKLWEARVIDRARQRTLQNKFKQEHLTDQWFHELVKLSRSTYGPTLAKKYIEQAGIYVIIEEQLPKTLLDGAAICTPQLQPIIGLTLRYDRTDNFWFVLLHELAHIALHLNNQRTFFDDLDGEADDLEDEADRFAQDKLIPASIWDTCISRFTLAETDVLEDAKRAEINPAIIAGRIRHETSNYTILTDLIGQGEVKRALREK